MTVCRAVSIVLSALEYRVLIGRARRARGEQRDVLRARIVLAAAGGQSNAAIARRLAITEDTVRRWRARFAAERGAGLNDRARSGRPRTFADVAAAEVKAMACALPAETGVPLARWSATELAAEAVTRGVVDTVSASTVRRWLRGDAIKPWQCRSWIFPRDPDFAAKAARVLDLYDRLWDGRALGPDEYVISADEKSQLQALHRRHPDLPPGPGRVRRQEFEYRREGTLAYLAGYDVHQARVIGRCAPTTGIEPFSALVEQVMTSQPYPARSGCSGSWTTAPPTTGSDQSTGCATRGPQPNWYTCPCTPAGSTKSRSSSRSCNAKSSNRRTSTISTPSPDRLLAFQDRYNATAEPFDWRFTRKSLNRLLERLAAHEAA